MANKKEGTPNYRDEKAIKAFGNKVRSLREKTGKTIEAFANDNKMHPTQLARIERGESNPTLSYIVKLAKILKVKPSELLDF